MLHNTVKYLLLFLIVLLGVGDIIQQNIEMYTEPQEKKTLDTERISM